MGSNYQYKVREFQIASGQPVDLDRPMTKEEKDFRENLLSEEIRELQSAIVDENRLEILDALCDIKYVNDGTANMLGCILSDDIMENNYSTPNYLKVESAIEELSTLCIDDLEEINSVIYDLAFIFGFTLENFKTALDRVHASNCSKFCYDVKTAERTQDFYAKQGIETYIEPVNKMTVVYREGDGKVLKSVNFHPVQLEDLI